MSFKKCDTLKAPSTLKRARNSSPTPSVTAATLFAMETLYLEVVLATCASVLREWLDESHRTLCVPPRTRLALGRSGIHRRHRTHRVSRRNLARPVRPADATR